MGTEPAKGVTTRPPHGPNNGPTVYLTDPLGSIYVYVNINENEVQGALANAQSGTVTFVTQAGSKLPTALKRCTFPGGTWEATVGKAGTVGYSLSNIVCKYPPVVDQNLVARLNSRVELKWITAPSDTKKMQALLQASEGRTVRIVVAYTRAANGNSRTLPDNVPLTSGNNKVLADPAVAEIYLQFVEHFGRVAVDYDLAKGGLTQAEIEQVEQNRPQIIDITNLFVAGFTDYQAAKSSAQPAVTFVHFRAMLEAIFFQRQVKNDLALRNLLKIGIGTLLVTDVNGKVSTKPDIGVMRVAINGARPLLVYDRYGAPVLGFNGPIDHEYRSVDLNKIQRDTSIPHLEIKVSDQGLYLFLRNLEQQLGAPLREVEALVASLYKYTIYITNEIHSRYNGQIGERIIQFAPAVIVFFVVHAIASRLLVSYPLAYLAYMALVKGAGLIFGLDFALLNMARLAEAGAHFNRLEEIHREKSKDPTLTKLSEYHLAAGAAALIDAMADFIALGVYIAAPLSLKTKPGRALVQGLKNAASAAVELVTDLIRAIEIRLRKPTTTLEAPIPKETNIGLLEVPDPNPSQPPIQKAIEHPNAGVPQEEVYGKQPAQKPIVVKRPRALDMTPADFAKDVAAQQELFQAAQDASARQDAFIQKMLGELNIKADAKSILKRPTFDEFVEGVLKKVGERKKGKYQTIGEMTDIIRGRVNVDLPEQVEVVFRKLTEQQEIRVTQVQRPLKRVGVPNAYPRYHLDVVDPETGIAHEWQIGTKQLTEFYEKPGIDVGKITIEAKNRNIHDIEYDIFKTIEDPDSSLGPNVVAKCRGIASKVDIHAFRVRVANFSAKLGKANVAPTELDSTTKALHDEASQILRDIVAAAGGDPAGVQFVESLMH